MRLKRQDLLPAGQMDKCSPYSRGDICPPEIRECDNAHTHDRYKNVFLSDEELTELKTELPTLWQTYIDRLSEYMASTGKQTMSDKIKRMLKNEVEQM